MTTTHDDKTRERFEAWFRERHKVPDWCPAQIEGTPAEGMFEAFRAALSPASTGQEAAHLARMKWQAYELDGVIADVEQGNGFDDICLNTVKRVRNILAQLPGDVAAPAQQVEAEIRDKALEEAAAVAERQPIGNSIAACIRKLKSAAGSNNGESHE